MVPTSSNNVQTNTVHFCNFTQASEDELRRAKPLEVPEFPLHTHTHTYRHSSSPFRLYMWSHVEMHHCLLR